jgi:hypothetical protein
MGFSVQSLPPSRARTPRSLARSTTAATDSNANNWLGCQRFDRDTARAWLPYQQHTHLASIAFSLPIENHLEGSQGGGEEMDSGLVVSRACPALSWPETPMITSMPPRLAPLKAIKASRAKREPHPCGSTSGHQPSQRKPARELIKELGAALPPGRLIEQLIRNTERGK